MNICVNEGIKFKWNWTKNIWLWKDLKDYKNLNFNKGELLCNCDKNEYLWIPKFIGNYYFACQIGNCAINGNMKLHVIVSKYKSKNNKHKTKTRHKIKSKKIKNKKRRLN